MANNYIGLTIRREVIERDGVNLGIETLKKVALEAMKYYYRRADESSPELEIQRLFPHNLGIEEYGIRPECDLRIKLSLEPEDYAPFNCWLEISRPNSREWALLIDLADHLSKEFPELTFNVNSDYFSDPACDEKERYTNLFKNGMLVRQLTRQEWAERYLGTKYPHGIPGIDSSLSHSPDITGDRPNE